MTAQLSPALSLARSVDPRVRRGVVVGMQRARHRPEVLALGLGALALHLGGPGQGGGAEFAAGQPLNHLLGFGRGQLADGQRGDLLHGRGLGALLEQAQQGGGEAPLAARPQ